MHILLTGASGQLGQTFLQNYSDKFNITAISRTAPEFSFNNTHFESVDISQSKTLSNFLKDKKFNAIINTAAYTNTDKAEDEPELAHAVNFHAVEILAEYASPRNTPVIHFSTDYVFDGKGDTPYSEEDSRNPLSVYGKSKLLGEQALEYSNCNSTVFRTAWVYSHIGKNFLTTMYRLFREKTELSIVSDQIGSPTSTQLLAEAAYLALKKWGQKEYEQKFNLYHLVNQGYCSWYDFAVEILSQLQNLDIEVTCKSLLPIKSSDYPAKIERPKNSRLLCKKFDIEFEPVRSDWKDALLNQCKTLK